MNVVVAGAGPAGLTAAIVLARHGIPVEVLDARSGPDQQPRALVLWAGCLEVLARLGIGDQVAAEGLTLTSARYSSAGRTLFTVPFGGLQGTRFPFPICLPQPAVQRMLLERLALSGVHVRWEHRVTTVASGPDGVEVGVTGPDGPRSVSADWLVGADGSRSVVREAVGVQLRGTTFEREFLLADGRLHAADKAVDQARYDMGPDGVMVVVPLPGGTHRIFTDREIVPGTSGDPEGVLADVSAALARRDPAATLEDVDWSSAFRIRSRVADRFRAGRVLLAGDAAHGHSPAGGQGLNTAVQDAFDLAWRLIALERGAGEAVLDGYDAERRPAARAAVTQSERQTRLWLLRGALRRRVRDAVMRAVGRRSGFQAATVARIAQLDLRLRNSPGLLPGRLPAGLGLPGVGRWSGLPMPGADADGFAIRHQVLVSGLDAGRRRELAADLPADVVVAEAPGARADGPTVLVWIRPDGVVGGVSDWDGRAALVGLLGRPLARTDRVSAGA